MRSAEAQVVHCLVNGIIGDQECLLTVVYGYNTIEQRKQLWDNLIKIGHGANKPWILRGNFNYVLQLQDRINENPGHLYEVYDFTKCVQDLGINELAWEGDYYTWPNKQDGMDRIWSRIDRLFGNNEWIMQYGHITIVYDVPFISDHAPMSLNLTVDQGNKRISFKFFNVWAEHETFLSIVHQVWNQRVYRWTMQDIWVKLKKLRPLLRKLNIEEFKFIKQKIDTAMTELLIV
ncbi:uncharacterized protein LOC142179968 [Nicotiana tabacum]|uniref:Uncharacterized protein LOC142179968 n=1 Tax=Nicotiana tabacum TaxID=4097 RepID=A0AC58UBW4_TOBAC